MIELVKRLQEKYDLFGEFFMDVKEASTLLKKQPELVKYAEDMGAELEKNNFHPKSIPESDGSRLGDMLPLLILLPYVEKMEKKYLARGFSHDETAVLLTQFRGALASVKGRIGRVGITQRYYDWLCLYLRGVIFRCGSLNFEIKNHDRDSILLKNKTDGRFAVLMRGGVFHRSGQVLGSAGYKDNEGCFFADFEENADCYIGREVLNGAVSKTVSKYPKREWECLLRQGDECAALHIPRGVDMSDKAVSVSLREGLQMIRTRYPERKVRCFVCTSWMIDPQLKAIMPDGSRVRRFGERFITYPIKDDGMDVFGFVFPERFDSFDTLPEDTSLQRKLKQLYIAGGHIYVTGGIIPV